MDGDGGDKAASSAESAVAVRASVGGEAVSALSMGFPHSLADDRGVLGIVPAMAAAAPPPPPPPGKAVRRRRDCMRPFALLCEPASGPSASPPLPPPSATFSRATTTVFG